MRNFFGSLRKGLYTRVINTEWVNDADYFILYFIVIDVNIILLSLIKFILSDRRAHDDAQKQG